VAVWKEEDLVVMAGAPRLSTREWLRSYDLYLSATIAHARYLRATGRLVDPESATDILALEEEQRRLHLRLARMDAEAGPTSSRLRLPQDPVGQLSLAARRELRRYRDEVCEDSRRLRARSAALVRRSREARRQRLPLAEHRPGPVTG